MKTKAADPIPGICEDAIKLGVSRVTLLRAIRGRKIPKDPTLLPRYYELQRAKAISQVGGFVIYPPEIFRVGDDIFMRTVAAKYPAAVRLVNGGLQCLQPIIFTITGQTPIPALPDSPAKPASA